jgi:asparagine synthase (glutamine-hydrolysing)
MTEREVKYWDPLLNAAAPPLTMQQAEDELEALLESSVNYRMEADTRVGVFLSGGLDSSYVLDVANGASSTMSTFTATYSDYPQYDEGFEALRTAGRQETRHFDVAIDEDTYLDVLISVAYYQDEPIAAPVCVPVYLLSQSAREADVPVVLAGEGSDEVFIGYDNWIRLRDAQRLANSIPSVLRRPLAGAARRILSPFAMTDRLGEMARRVETSVPLFWGGAMDFTVQGQRSIAGPRLSEVASDTYEHTIKQYWADYCENRHDDDITGWMSYLDLKFRLPELMLPRLDKMGMAFSVEGRVPFLDHRIVEFVMGLPPAMRASRGRVGKPLFKKVAARRLSNDMVYQKKRGFQAPVKEWKRGAFQDRFVRSLSTFSERTELFDTTAVKKLLERPSDRLYFTLVNFMLWHCLFVDNVLEDELGDVRSNVRFA